MVVSQFPGQSFRGELPELTAAQRELSARLRKHVEHLAGDLGEKNILNGYDSLIAAENYVYRELQALGYEMSRQEYRVTGHRVANVIAEKKGSTAPEEIVIFGAHYDSAPGTAGANDNCSAVAALIELARAHKDDAPSRTVRYIGFVNEEPPYFMSGEMGSQVYAKAAYDAKENIVGMIALETMGYYSDKPGSQEYPPPVGALYPDTGNFIGFVGDLNSEELVAKSIAAFREAADFPSEGIAAPEELGGVALSDHASFWKYGYQALMVTDTAPFRYPHYHSAEDTPDKVDYDRLARVTEGLSATMQALTAPE